MRRITLLVAMIGIGLLLPASASADQQQDQAIAQEVMKKLSHQKKLGKLKNFKLDLQVEEGAVTLRGHVSEPSQRYLVLDLARRVRGVTQVVNGIKVVEQTETAAAPQEPQKAKAPTALEPIKRSVVPSAVAKQPTTAPKNPAASKTAVQPVAHNPQTNPNDDQIAQHISGLLKEAKSSGKLKGFGINMQVDKGVVWLKGRVSTDQQLGLVIDIARFTPGVKKVVNEMAIKSGTISNASNPHQAPLPVAKSNVPMSQNDLASKIAKTVTRPMKNTPIGAGLPNGGLVQPVQANVQAQLLGPPPQVAAPPQTALPPQAAMPQPIPTQHYIPTHRPTNQRPLPIGAPRGGSLPPGMIRPISQPGPGGGYIPSHMPGNPMGAMPAQHDHPQMPAYAWPAYASHPNYGAVTYPKQYSPSAWPYIGPFYPYPQVPLGWREVSLKWKDGWWMMDFKDRHAR